MTKRELLLKGMELLPSTDAEIPLEIINSTIDEAIARTEEQIKNAQLVGADPNPAKWCRQALLWLKAEGETHEADHPAHKALVELYKAMDMEGDYPSNVDDLMEQMRKHPESVVRAMARHWFTDAALKDDTKLQDMIDHIWRRWDFPKRDHLEASWRK